MQDITFEIEATEEGNWPSFTVYYLREPVSGPLTDSGTNG